MIRKRICIIGGGASGLGCARVLAQDEYNCEPTVFEQNSTIGGQWIYDPSGTSETSGVYKNLKTNLPCDAMQYSDFPFANHDPESFVGPQDVREYLIDYTEKHQLLKYVVLNTKVRSVDETFTVIYSSKNEIFNRPYQKLLEKHENDFIYSEQFDAIIVANGHYTEMYIPNDIPGFDSRTFPIMHSHTYREPEHYQNQCIIVVGGSHSGVDIAGELSTVTKQVFLSIKEENRYTFDRVLDLLHQSGKQTKNDYTSLVSIIPQIEYIDKDTVYFTNKMSIKPDLIIFATGYEYQMPFLQGYLQVDQYRLLKYHYVYPLYKQIFHAHFPNGTLSFLGIPFRIVPFPLAEIQTHLIARVLDGKISLPSQDEMIHEIDNLSLPQNRTYHAVDVVKYAENLLEMMNDSDQYFDYKFTIDNQRRVRKIYKNK